MNLTAQSKNQFKSFLIDSRKVMIHAGKGLTENLSGLWRYRVKNYRLICFIQDEELIVLFLDISKRDEVYTDRNVKSILKNVPTK